MDKSVVTEGKTTNEAIKEGNEKLVSMLGNLTFNSRETESAVKYFIDIFKEV